MWNRWRKGLLLKVSRRYLLTVQASKHLPGFSHTSTSHRQAVKERLNGDLMSLQSVTQNANLLLQCECRPKRAKNIHIFRTKGFH